MAEIGDGSRIRQRKMIDKLSELMIALSATAMALHGSLLLMWLAFSMLPFGSRFQPTWFVISFVVALGVFCLSTQFYLQRRKK